MPGWRERLTNNWSQAEGSARDFLGRLTPSQRISLGLLAAIVLLGMSFIIVLGRSDAPKNKVFALGPSDDQGNSLLAESLRQRNIRYEITDEGIVVDPTDESKVQAVLAESEDLARHPDRFEWLEKPPSWQTTNSHQRARLHHSMTLKLEQTIDFFEGVERAIVNVPLNQRSLFVESANPTTASVHIVGEVDNKRARAIQSLVGSAFSIRPELVAVSDDRGPRRLGSDIAHDERQAGINRENQQKVHKLLARVLRPGSEYTVTVSSQINRSKSVESSKGYDADQSVSLVSRKTREKSESRHGLRSPGVEPNVVRGGGDQGTESDSLSTTHEREDVESENRFGEVTRTTELPAGDLEQLNVVVWVALEALRDKALSNLSIGGASKSEADITADDIADVKREFEDAIYTLVALKGVETSVQIFASSSTDGGRTQDTASSEPRVASFVQMHGREILLAVLSIVGCFFLYRIATRSVPQVETVSDPVADLRTFLEEKERRDRERELAEAEASNEPEPIDWEANEEDREALELLKAVTEFAQDRPELAATVLRNWVGESGPPAKPGAEEGATPAPEMEKAT